MPVTISHLSPYKQSDIFSFVSLKQLVLFMKKALISAASFAVFCRTGEPLLDQALWNSPLAMGDVINAIIVDPPELCPNNVTYKI